MKSARINFIEKQSRDSCQVIVRYGETDTMKTYNGIHNDWPGEKAYVKVCTEDNKWFCGLDGERKVILDEFRGSKQKFSLGTVNQWLQPHDICYVEPTFGRCKLIADKFVLTSSMHPMKWFPANANDDDDNIDQLLRRITVLYHHTKTQPVASPFVTQHTLIGEPVYIVETRRQPNEPTPAWCARVRAMPDAQF